MRSLLVLSQLVLLASASPVLRKRQSIEACLSSSSLDLITSSSSGYTGDVAAFNQRIQPDPEVILYPSTPEQISAIIQCASKAKASVTARSGGHSYASNSLTGDVVIDLSAFKDISVGEDGVATVGAGNKLGDVALALNDKGKALPHGVCPYVGIGGHAAYGGFGYPSRLWGLTLDTIVAYDVVSANGTVLSHLTVDQDADLFWALRGSAPSFGIITAYYMSTQNAPPSAINFKFGYDSLSVADQVTAFSAYQSFGSKKAPAELGLTYTVSNGGGAEISGVYYGSMADFNAVIAPLEKAIPDGYKKTTAQNTWIESVQALAGNQKLDTSDASDYRDDFYAKSLMTPNKHLITDNALKTFFQYLANTKTSTSWFIEVNLYGGDGSAINNQSLSDSSFGHRNALLTFQLYASSSSYQPPYPDEGFTFIEGAYDSIVGTMKGTWGSSFGAYVNYIDTELSQAEANALYWRDQYGRLSSLKGRYDPQNTFSFPQGIQASS